MTDAPEIDELFDTYLAGYNDLDAHTLAAVHATPCIIVHRGEIVTLDDRNKVSYHEAILGANAAEGEHHWELADIDVDRIGPNGAVAKVHWIARRPDGSVLWEDHPAYMLARGERGWTILGNISSDS